MTGNENQRLATEAASAGPVFDRKRLHLIACAARAPGTGASWRSSHGRPQIRQPRSSSAILTCLRRKDRLKHRIVPGTENVSVPRSVEQMSDSLVLAGRTFSSRLFVGTGKYASFQLMVKAIEASGAEVVTVAVRRVNISDRSKESLLDYLDTKKYFLLPNTAGCYTAADAIRTAQLGPRGGAVELGQAGGDRRRAYALPRQRGAGRGDAASSWLTASSCFPTRATTWSSAGSWRTRAPPLSCRSARRSVPASASRTSTTSGSSASRCSVPVIVDAGVGHRLRRRAGHGAGRRRRPDEHGDRRRAASRWRWPKP